MKRLNRLLAALLAALTLCAALPLGGVAETVIDLGEPEGLEELESALPALDDALLSDGSGIELEEMPAEDVDAPREAGPVSNDGSDFEISGDTLVRYTGSDAYVIIPDGVTRIGNGAFSQNTNLVGVVIPEGVAEIGESAFAYCESLYSVSLPDSLRVLGQWAFEYCSALESIRLPEGLTSIGGWAFFGCNSLTAVTVPASVREVKEAVFSSCASLKTIKVASGNRYLKAVNNVLYRLDPYQVVCCAGMNTSAVIPEGVTAIGFSAFCDCSKLEKLTIPASVTFIDIWAVSGCTSLKEVLVYAEIIEVSDTNCFNDTNPVFHTVPGSDMASWARTHGFTAVEDLDGSYAPTPSLSATKLSLNVGQSKTLKVKNQEGRKVTWASSNKKVATVSSGKVTAKGAGSCTVSAKVAGFGTLKCKVTVANPAKLSAKSLTLSAVDTATLKLTGAAGQTVKWASSRSAVAKITKSSAKSATVKGVKAGSSVISAKVGGKTLKCSVKVVNPLKLSVDALEQLAGENILHIRFANQSSKKITYVKFDVLQYDGQGRRLESPYAYYDSSKAVKAHGATVARVYVNGSTVKVKFKIIEVRFSNGATWKP